MFFIIHIVFFLLLVAATLCPFKNKYNYVVFCGFGFVLFLLSAFRPAYGDADYGSYVELFNGEGASIFMEPTFTLISFIVHHLFFEEVRFLFIIYALIGVYLKLFSIRKYSDFLLPALLIYLCNIYLIQDMIQIRVGVACGVFLLSIKPLYDRDFKRFIFIIIIASLFHYSLMITAFMWFLDPKKLHYRLYLIAILGVYFLHLINIHIASLIGYINIPFLQYKISSNLSQEELTLNAPVNVFNILQLLRLCAIAGLLLLSKQIYHFNQYALLFIKLYFFSIISLVLFADNGLYAFRISQMFGVVEMITIPYFFYVLKPTHVIKVGVSLFATVLFYVSVYLLVLVQ